MGPKLQKFFQKNREWITYLFFGMLTTLVNYSIYLPLYNGAVWSATACNTTAWAVSVVFSFWVNRIWVFRSRGPILREFPKFVGYRLGSGVAETVVLFLLTDICGLNGNAVKLLTGIMTVAVNYISGKLLVFRK